MNIFKKIKEKLIKEKLNKEDAFDIDSFDRRWDHKCGDDCCCGGDDGPCDSVLALYQAFHELYGEKLFRNFDEKKLFNEEE